jgi:hypothetical protein
LDTCEQTFAACIAINTAAGWDAPISHLLAKFFGLIDHSVEGGAVGSSKLFTPLQIRAGTFFGGPIAAVYFLRENFRVLGRLQEVRATHIWGAAFVVGLMLLLPFMPEHFPNYVIPLAYSYAAGAVATKWQLQKEAIVESGTYQRQSNWRVLGLALLFLIAFALLIVIEIFCLNSIGIIKM